MQKEAAERKAEEEKLVAQIKKEQEESMEVYGDNFLRVSSGDDDSEEDDDN